MTTELAFCVLIPDERSAKVSQLASKIRALVQKQLTYRTYNEIALCSL